MTLRAILTAFAIVVVAHASPGAKGARYDVTQFGATGDGATINTRSIQDAIDHCATAGGGVVVIPPGTFVSGALFFKPGVNLRVEKGATLKSTTRMEDFPPIYTRWEGIERYWTAAFLNFIGLRDVTVEGEGTIDGSGDAWAGFGERARPAFDRRAYEEAQARAAAMPLPKVEAVYPSPRPTTATLNFAPDPAHLPPVNAAGVRLPSGLGPLAPPRAIVFQNCTNVRISGLLLRNQARWGYVFVYCEHVIADHLTARAEHYIPSSDGMDIDSCRDVLVIGCDFDCNDDCISIKSGKDEDGRRVNRPCENIVIEQTRFAYGHGGAAIGSETSGGIRRVEVRDCVAEAGNWAPVRIKSQPTRGGVIEDIVYRNLTLNGVKQAFELDLAWNLKVATPEAERNAPTVRNVRIAEVHGTAISVGRIHGLPDSPVRNVVFEGCSLTAERGLVIDHARDIQTDGLALTVRSGPAVIRR